MKHSKQRDLILEVVMNSCEHPTADMIYKEVKNKFPNISLGTIYRNLNLLVDLGYIKKISMPNGSDRFDKTTYSHYHFHCNQCDNIFDIESSKFKDLNKIIKKEFNHNVYYHDIVFIGECSNCINIKKKEG